MLLLPINVHNNYKYKLIPLCRTVTSGVGLKCIFYITISVYNADTRELMHGSILFRSQN